MTVSHTNPGQLHSGDAQPHDSIIQIDQNHQIEAIERLVATGSINDRANAQRFIHYAKTNEIALESMWGRLGDRGKIIHTVLAVPNAGRTAMLFASHPHSQEDVISLGGLLDYVAKQLVKIDIHLAQILLEPKETLEQEATIAGGFEKLATLTYLQRPISKRTMPPEPIWPQGVTVEQYRDDIRDDVLTAVLASYEQTLDCPGLFGLREPNDILAGHQATGKFDPALWTLLRVDGKPSGVVLLNPFPKQRTVELVYIGLAPIARGKSLGKQLLRHALRLLDPKRARTITLAVDDVNTPALDMYKSEGFESQLERIAFIRSLLTESKP